MKMKFEEQFPSLKGKRYTFDGIVGCLYSQGNIQEHCLDKAKTLQILQECKNLEEAIKRIKNGNA